VRRVSGTHRLGFTLDEVAELLDAGRRRHPTRGLQERARAKPDEVGSRMADLARIRDGLLQAVEARCDRLTHCTCPDCTLPFVELADLRPAPIKETPRERQPGPTLLADNADTSDTAGASAGGEPKGHRRADQPAPRLHDSEYLQAVGTRNGRQHPRL
jgi:hypothetical protein